MLMIPFAWTSVDSTRVSGRKAFLKAFLSKEQHFSGQLLSFTVKDPCDQKIRKNKERKKQIYTDSRYKNSNEAATLLPAAKHFL